MRIDRLARLGLNVSLGWCSAVLATSCSSDPPSGAAEGGVGTEDGGGEDTGEPTPAVDPDAFMEVYAEVQAAAKQMGVDGFLTEYAPPPYLTTLSYDPAVATGLDAIEQVYPLSTAQHGALADHGFVALADQPGQTFESLYHQIYFADLPVLITADSVLYALHRSFDAILMDLEQTALVPELDAMLREMHEGLAADLQSGVIPAELSAAATDADIYLTVSRRLLTGESVPSVTGTEADARVDDVLMGVETAGVGRLDLFGRGVDYDYSQFTPRGHYEFEPVLQRYFQAMIWLGRTDLQLVSFEDGKPVFNRLGFDGAYLLGHLLDSTGANDRWTRLEGVLRTMIGDPDSMSPGDMPKLAEGLGNPTLAELSGIADEKIFEHLVAGRYGLQRIMSQIMFTDPADPPLLLPRVYLLMGQRFTVDSYVFNNVTYDRVQNLQTGTKVPRMLPDELDVQFVLGSNEAGSLLEPQLQEFGYQGLLHELRFLVDAHPPEFWDASFYSGWLAALRALNADASEWGKYPEAMRTQAWQHKTLNTQAASRAELRHDTLLYVKQSYSGGITCEYPDGYVEPLAGFYDRMAHLGTLGEALVDDIEAAGYESPHAREYFVHWSAVMTNLQGIAEQELAGQQLTGEQIAFLGQTVEQETVGCGEIAWDGWYPGLFYDTGTLGVSEPTIADVHTAPTDASGNDKGWVLHAATGKPMLMVLTVPSCDGEPAAYIGPISSQFSVLTEGYSRLTDSQWAEQLFDENPARPSWTGSFIP